MPSVNDYDKHACSIYQYSVEQVMTTWKFFKEGFKAGEKCIYIADSGYIERLTAEIKKSGENLEEYLNSGKLIILSSDTTYIKNGLLDASSMQPLLSDAEKKAIIEGYTGLRVSGELPLIAGKPIDSDSIGKYESEIDDYLLHCGSVRALCNYDRNIHNPQTLGSVINFHRKIKIYGKTYKNEFYRTIRNELYTSIIDRLIEDESVVSL